MSKSLCLKTLHDLLPEKFSGPKYEACRGHEGCIACSEKTSACFAVRCRFPLAPRYKSPLTFRAATRSSASTCRQGGMGITRRIVVGQMFTITLVTQSSRWSMSMYINMGVSKNRGTPNHPKKIGFSSINHPFSGYPYFWKHPYIHHLYHLSHVKPQRANTFFPIHTFGIHCRHSQGTATKTADRRRKAATSMAAQHSWDFTDGCHGS